jgi:hypothetical protein
MPEWMRKIRSIYRPLAPPIFVDIGTEGVTPEDIALARELFNILDEESKEWYRRNGILKDIDCTTKSVGKPVTKRARKKKREN